MLIESQYYSIKFIRAIVASTKKIFLSFLFFSLKATSNLFKLLNK